MPFVNGYEFAFDSIEFRLGLAKVDYIESISWSDDVDMTEVRGTGGRLVDLLQGNYSARGSLTLAKTQEEDFLGRIGPGAILGKRSFDLVVTCQVEGRKPITETLWGVRLSGRRDSHQARSGVLVVSFDFKMTGIQTGNRLDGLHLAETLS